MVVFRTEIEYVALGVNQGKFTHGKKVVPPSILYSKSVPIGEVKAMVAVGTKQVGWVMLPAGAAGLAGNGLIVKGVAAERQPVFTSRTVML